MNFLTVDVLYSALKEPLKLRLITKKSSLKHKIHTAEIHRPGLALCGYYEHFSFSRIQILGQTEVAYIESAPRTTIAHALDKFFTYNIPCILVSKDLKVPAILMEKAEKAKVPILRSPITTSKIISRVTVFIEEQLAPTESLHGTLLDVYGVGILLLGKSGVGKSECALELVERGHRLVADDVVEVRKQSQSVLLGVSNETIRHHMEIRGLGIINIQNVFGVGAVRNQKRIRLVVTLERWNLKKEYERLGLEDQNYKILDVLLPHLTIPVRPGRNIPILIEVAALQQREKRMGVHSAEEFNNHLIQKMTGKKPKPVFIEDAD